MKRRCQMPQVLALAAALAAGLGTAGAALAVTGDVVAEFPTPGSCPTGLTFDGSSLWLADRKTDSLYSISPKEGRVIAAVPAPGYQVDGLAWDGKYLWVLDLEDKVIHKFNPRTGISEKRVAAPSETPRGLAWDGSCLWAADPGTHQIYRFSIDDGTTIVSFPSPALDPSGIAFDGTYLWVADRITDTIYMVTPDKGEVILSFPAPGKYARGLAFDGTHLWNVDYQSDRLYRLVRKDGVPYARTDGKKERLEYTHEFRNYGPGTVTTGDIYLALAQDLPNQELHGEIAFRPAPDEIVADRWGQKVARYRVKDLPPGGIWRASMTVEAELFQTRWFVFPEEVGTLKEIPKGVRDLYLGDEDKYRITDPVIVKAVREAVGEEQNAYWVARKVFDYVIAHMEYQLLGGWNVAPTVLARGNGSCSEYAFVYIAMARAAGLPARYAGSVAVRGDDASTDDVFHRWVEVYLPHVGWMPIDPSGGDQPTPAGQASYIGHLNNKYLITTLSGGGSEFLEWDYNSNEIWASRGKCKVYSEKIGEWSPLPGE